MKLSRFPLLELSLCTVGCLVSFSNSAIAQVTSDGTTGTTVNADGNNFTIQDGTRSGGNLFHSFQDFSVPTGGVAFFDNAVDVSNILSRVTGGNISNIDGVIGANGSANLFLINPAGIIFGENASLDIGGSFYGSTADGILFDDGEFSAVNNLNAPILTINAPIGLGFRDSPGEIVNNSLAEVGRGLSVSAGNSISLLGGDVTFNGGRATAPAGIINLGGLAAAGEIAIEVNNNFSFPEGIARSNVALSDGAIVDVTSDGGGLIAVNANNLELTGASLFLANIGEDLGAENAVAGTIELNTTNISADGASLIQADNLGIGRGGEINISTDNLDFTGGSAITASTFGLGDAGNINITARDITIDFEFSGIYSNVGLTNIASESLELETEGVVGNAGIINIDTENLTLLNGARILTTSIAQGDGGDININATGNVLYQGLGETPVPAFGGGTVISGSFSQVQQEGVGNSGSVNITANSLRLFDVGAVLTNNSGVGDAGDITLDIANDIVLDGTGLILAQTGEPLDSSQSQSGIAGNGGDIIINANSLFADNTSFVLVDTTGVGNAGNIDINLARTLSLNNISIITAAVQPGGVVNAGNININASDISLDNGSRIESLTVGEGNAGNINIQATEQISINNEGSSISGFVGEDGVGDSGDINLTTNLLSLTNEGEINSSIQGQGNGGRINVAANEVGLVNGEISTEVDEGGIGNAGDLTFDVVELLISDEAELNSSTSGQGNAGEININANVVSLFNGEISTAVESEGVGDGGNIRIDAADLVTISGSNAEGFSSGLFANTAEGAEGNAGNISISTDDLNIADNGIITVDSQGMGNGGIVDVRSDTLNLEGNASITAATAFGQGGNITLQVNDIINLKNNSLISVQAFNDADGGNLAIDTRFIIGMPNQNNDILASAEAGSGGNINISFISIFGFAPESSSLNPREDPANNINAGSDFGLDGSVESEDNSFLGLRGFVTNPIVSAVDIDSSIKVVPLDSEQTLAQACQIRRQANAKSGLTIEGKGGIVPEPGLPLNSLNVSVAGEDNSSGAIPEAIATSKGKIQPARGVKVANNGEIVLTAYRTDNAGQRIIEAGANCGV